MKRFKKIYIEITNACNLTCSFCPRSKREKMFMNISQFKHIIHEVFPYTDYVYFHVKGEPFLHPLVGEFLSICNDSHIKVNITTNGTLLKDVSDVLLNSPALRQINISLHSFEDENNFSAFETYINNILEFASIVRKNTNCIISFRLWNLEENCDLLNKKKNLYVIKKLENYYHLEPGSIHSSFLSQNIRIRGIKLDEKTFLNQDFLFTWPSLDADFTGDTGFCHGLREQCAILSDGTVIPCCLDGEGNIPLGNIYNTPFKEIIASKRAADIIEGFSNRKISENLCKHCGYRNRF